MKKCVLLLLLVALLTGCGTVETFEALGQVDHVSPTQPQLRQIRLDVPADAAVETSGTEEGVTVYTCDSYLMVLQNFSSGDLTSTIRALSGFSPEQLTVMESTCQDHNRHDWVWTAVSEEGELVCRGAVLDDGNYHYALCVMAPSAEAGQLQNQWNALFSSFCLET